jgi:hypothetical protein
MYVYSLVGTETETDALYSNHKKAFIAARSFANENNQDIKTYSWSADRIKKTGHSFIEFQVGNVPFVLAITKVTVL